MVTEEALSVEKTVTEGDMDAVVTTRFDEVCGDIYEDVFSPKREMRKN